MIFFKRFNIRFMADHSFTFFVRYGSCHISVNIQINVFEQFMNLKKYIKKLGNAKSII